MGLSCGLLCGGPEREGYFAQLLRDPGTQTNVLGALLYAWCVARRVPFFSFSLPTQHPSVTPCQQAQVSVELDAIEAKDAAAVAAAAAASAAANKSIFAGHADDAQDEGVDPAAPAPAGPAPAPLVTAQPAPQARQSAMLVALGYRPAVPPPAAVSAAAVSARRPASPLASAPRPPSVLDRWRELHPAPTVTSAQRTATPPGLVPLPPGLPPSAPAAPTDVDAAVAQLLAAAKVRGDALLRGDAPLSPPPQQQPVASGSAKGPGSSAAPGGLPLAPAPYVVTYDVGAAAAVASAVPEAAADDRRQRALAEYRSRSPSPPPHGRRA